MNSTDPIRSRSTEYKEAQLKVYHHQLRRHCMLGINTNADAETTVACNFPSVVKAELLMSGLFGVLLTLGFLSICRITCGEKSILDEGKLPLVRKKANARDLKDISNRLVLAYASLIFLWTLATVFFAGVYYFSA
jgi:hypothetical protein